MKTKQALLLEAIGKIRLMERGTLCLIRKGPSASYYNHQSWERGRNRVRYVPAAQLAALREAMAGYSRFMELVQGYAEQVIRETRLQLAKQAPRHSSSGPAGGAGRKPSRPPTPGGKGENGRSRAGEARRRTARRAGGRD
jgi:hypothetical protein